MVIRIYTAILYHWTFFQVKDILKYIFNFFEMNILSIWIGKTISFIIKLFHLGSGETWSGEIILRLNANFLNWSSKKLDKGIIVLSGTNGKTTTALLIASILEKAGFSVLHNATGANLLNGIASIFITNFDLFGRLKNDIAVLEVDEANLPKLLKYITPSAILLLNLSRDQLDRYGEVEIMFEKWKEALVGLSKKTNLILNKDDRRVSSLANNFAGNISFFTLEQQQNWPFPLLGQYNQYNTLAAIEVAKTMGVSYEIIIQTLNEFKPAFGRGEDFDYNGRKLKMFLAKNPASFNVNLKMIIENLNNSSAILLILNDNIPDGRDVSWIYDIHSTLLTNVCKDKKIFVSGKRHHDMALRLKYAGILYKNIWHSPDVEKMIQTMIQQTNDGDLCLILPTYSAMLESRKIICGKSIL